MVCRADITKKWYALDGNAIDSIDSLKRLLDKLHAIGRDFAHNVFKRLLITKTKHIDRA